MQVSGILKKRLILWGLILLLIHWGIPILWAQSAGENRNQFYDVAELTKLIQRAKEAGFSDEELKKLQIQDGNRTINVNDYIKKIEHAKIFEQEKLNNFKKKKFLTIKDIYIELIKLEPDVLTRLREELVSEQ